MRLFPETLKYGWKTHHERERHSPKERDQNSGVNWALAFRCLFSHTGNCIIYSLAHLPSCFSAIKDYTLNKWDKINFFIPVVVVCLIHGHRNEKKNLKPRISSINIMHSLVESNGRSYTLIPFILLIIFITKYLTSVFHFFSSINP